MERILFLFTEMESRNFGDVCKLSLFYSKFGRIAKCDNETARQFFLISVKPLIDALKKDRDRAKRRRANEKKK